MLSSRCSAARMTASWSMSIADSTACSASSEYGGRRSRYGSRARVGAIEYSTGELDIFPGGALPGGVPEEGGRMIRHHERHAVVLMNLTTQLPDGQLCVEKSLCGEGPQRQKNFWSDELDLSHQIRTACGHFFRSRVAIARRPVLQDVADEHVLARKLKRAHDFRQQLPGLTDERSSCLVFSRPRRLADDHEFGAWT